MKKVVFDITEFLRNPIRSGIQRVIRELIINWPSTHGSLQYARFDPSRRALIEVADRIVKDSVDLERPFSHPLTPSEALDLDDHLEKPIRINESDTVFVPEVFYDHDRIDFYRFLIKHSRTKICFIVYDFIPWLKPSDIEIGVVASNYIMPYLMLIMQVRHRCFISSAVRADFIERIFRKPGKDAGSIIPLGSDGIRMERQRYRADRNEIVLIGTLDGKKRQDIVFKAFLTLPQGKRGKLVCLGKIPKTPAPWMRDLLACNLDDVEIVDSPSEEVLAKRLRGAKTTVFISTSEGFGLPAVESLYLGIPVVAHEKLPSLALVPGGGQIRLPTISVDTVAHALARLTIDGEVSGLWAEASSLALPTWKDYATAVAAWLDKASWSSIADESGIPR